MKFFRSEMTPPPFGNFPEIHSNPGRQASLIPLRNEFFDNESFRGPFYLKKRQIEWVLFESVGIWQSSMLRKDATELSSYAALNDMVGYCGVLCEVISFHSRWLCMILFGTVWFGTVWFGTVW